MRVRLKPDAWASIPINIKTNPITGALDGDDHGYRDVPDVPSEEPMIDVGNMVLCTGDYDGKDIYGGRKRVLPGGVRDGKFLLRQTFAEGLVALDKLVYRITGGNMQFQLVDGYRTPMRQAAGFTETMAELAGIDGLKLDSLVPWQQVKYGRMADLTFSWVRLAPSAELDVTKVQLLADKEFTQDLQDAIDAKLITGTLDEAVGDYILHSVNNNLGRAAGRGIKLNGNRNAHSGGGAVDLMVRGKLNGKTVPLSHVPFDYADPISGMMYLEGDNFDAYVALAKSDLRLTTHLQKLGFPTPDAFKKSDWEIMRVANRIRYYAFMTAGGSFYDPGDPTQAGENWHFQLGNIVYSTDGNVLMAEPNLSDKHPNAGNTCHSLLRMKPEKRMAVRTGDSAWQLVEKNFGHVA